MLLTELQAKVWNNKFDNRHRWNVSYGATRSGKTFLDYLVIPRRILETKNQGLIVLIGYTQGTVETNILEPLRKLFGSQIGTVNNKNEVSLFGKKCYAFGADNKRSVNRLRGKGIEYCYGDEVATWDKGVFDMLKSRLDKPNSCCDLTCNPESPNHWFKLFLDDEELKPYIYQQKFTLYDNTFLTNDFVKALEKEYREPIFHQRYILGNWVMAEGSVYSTFSSNKQTLVKEFDKTLLSKGFISIGMDFGGNKSYHSITATFIQNDYKYMHVLECQRMMATNTNADDVAKFQRDFTDKVTAKYKKASWLFCDSAEQVLIATIRSQTNNISVKNSVKNEINERIQAVLKLFNREQLFVNPSCKELIQALETAVYDDNEKRLDDGTSDIDSLDSFEYSWEFWIKQIMRG